MSSRLSNMEWIVCLLIVYTGSVIWSPVDSVSVNPNPPKPVRIEDQAKFFQDFFSVQLSPYKIEFGHVCEDPNNWEQRYEKKDFKNHRDMGKVRWGDKLGGYGEHYWDLNHAGHSDGHGDDNYGSDHGYNDSDDSYDEPSEDSPHYDSSESNNFEETPKYDNEDGNRNKRAHTRVKNQERSRKVYKKPKEEKKDEFEEETNEKQESLQADHSHKVEREHEEDIPKAKPIKHKRSHLKRHRVSPRVEHQPDDSVNENPRETIQHQQQKNEETIQNDAENNEPTKYVTYEQGSGVRQHYHPELTPAASAPRLFWEPATGRVVDRATGQAYVLQPVALNN